MLIISHFTFDCVSHGHRYVYVKNNINLHYFNWGPTQKVTTSFFQEAAFLFQNRFWCFHVLLKGCLILHHQLYHLNRCITLTGPTRQQILQLMMTRLESKLAQTHVALTGSTRQQVLQLMMTRLESKFAQTHGALASPMRQLVLQLMMTRLESKLAQSRVALTGPTRQQVLQLMMTRWYSVFCLKAHSKIWVNFW